MALGEWLNRNPMVGAGIAVVALVIAGFIVFRSTGGGETAKLVDQRYYYDMESGELITMENQPAPVTTESGSEAVWATVYACNNCDDSSDRFIAHLQKYTEEAKGEAQKAPMEQDYDTVQNGTMVAWPPENAGDNVNWVQIESGEGMQITQGAGQGRCPGMPIPCTP